MGYEIEPFFVPPTFDTDFDLGKFYGVRPHSLAVLSPAPRLTLLPAARRTSSRPTATRASRRPGLSSARTCASRSTA